MFFPTGHRITVAAVILRDARVLLVRHSFGERHWTLPAGSLDRGETLAAAAQREALEETGLIVEVAAPMTVFEVPEKHQLIVPFLCVVVGGTLQTRTAETTDARYWRLDALPPEMRHMHAEIIAEAATAAPPVPAPSAPRAAS